VYFSGVSAKPVRWHASSNSQPQVAQKHEESMLGPLNQLKPRSESRETGRRKPTSTAALASRADSAGTAVEKRRAIAVFSRDEAVVNMIAEALGDSWVMVNFTNPQEAHAALLKPGIAIVVIDDEALEESSRGWLLEQVRKWAPHALVAYIAAIHNQATERRARTYRVQYYTSKPMDRERTTRVLHSFERAAR
jgi:hypothetical protein